MKSFLSRVPRPLRILALAGVAVVGIGVMAAGPVNRKITSWMEGESFRQMLNKETSKGLKLQADYGPIQRVGFFGMEAPSFQGTNGSRTIVSLEAKGITGSFNPLGIILRRWEIDRIHLDWGKVMLQKTEPIPGAPKGPPLPPWWALFWPYRVQLSDVKVDDANILWKLQDKESGIYKTFLEITPNRRDFEYDARGGELRTPMTPPLQVQHAHMLIRKPRLYCPEFILGDDPAHPEQQVRLKGEAGLQDDRSMKLKIDLVSLDLPRWIKGKMSSQVEGHFGGHLDYSSTGTGLETGSGQGTLHVDGGVLRDFPPVRQYITVTGSPDPGDIHLKICQADLRWQGGAITVENLEVEAEGIFRVTGTATLTKDKELQGELQLGLTDPYLKWLPTAKSAIFTRDEGPYHFATIHLSGTLKKPQQDLSERLTKEVEKSPGVVLKLFFNAVGDFFSVD